MPASTNALDAPLDRDSDVPMVDQIQNRVIDAVAEGRLVHHERLPSERALSAALGVSRLTVQAALGRLVAKGTLYALRGRGTFVADPKIEQPLRELTSFSQDVTARGQQQASEVLDQRVLPAPIELAPVLGVPEGSEVVRLKRLRSADGEPLVIEVSHISHALCPGILSHDLAKVSLYAVLRETYGLSLTSARQSIEADQPTAEEIRVLHLPTGTPVLRTARVTLNAEGQVIEFARSAYRGDRYQLTVDLH